MRSILIITLTFMVSILISCNKKTKGSLSEKNSDIGSDIDTLKVGYTYWWGQSGPFIGLCGEEYSLAFIGTIIQINMPIEDTISSYIPQKGLVEIDSILKARALEKNRYRGEKFFLSDCFYNLDVKEGDKVIVFCYEYEGNFCISGRNSIIKIEGQNDPVVKSIKRYIDADQNPIEIKDDMELWATHKLDSALSQIINCKETSDIDK